jgi:TolB protein
MGENVVKKIAVLSALAILGLMLIGSAGRHAPQMAGPDVGGKIAYVRTNSIWLYSNGEQQQLTSGPQDRNDKRDAYPSFSPDGTQMVYTRYDEGFSDLYRLDVSNPSEPVALTNNRPTVEVGQAGGPGITGYNEQALWALQPAWSPDGASIAFTIDAGTEYPGLFSIDPDGIRQVKLESLNHGIQTVERPTWSPDGSKIAVANYVTDNGKGQIWIRNLQLGRWIALTNSADGAYDPAWSPDGEWIAFTMRQGSSHNIYVVPTDAQTWEGDYPTPVQVTTDGASRLPVWSPDGTRLAYLSLRDTSFDLYAGDIEIKANGAPGLVTVQRLTEKAHIDASGGISWGQ